MGNAESSVNGGDDTNYDNDDDTRYDDDYDANDEYAKQFDGIETLGYRVLGVQPGSPASQAGLVSFFDFIVGANQEMLLGSGEELDEGDEYDDVDFPKLLQDNVNGTITLLVWNIKAQEKRIVELSPRTDWGGAGLLGVTIKLDNYGGADEHLIRVLEVDDNESPAKLAGLIPNEDYLLGTTGTALSDTDVLASVLQLHINKVVELYVYNSTTDLVRIVGLHPTFRWGDGYSLFGAAVGQGYLHRLPKGCRSTIGKSIERKVSVHNRDQSLSESNILHEPTLEMEVDDVDDEDVGLANIANHNNNNTRSREAQPHQLGSSMETSTATEHPTPAGSEKYERNDNNSMRSISLKTSYEAPPPVPPMEAFRQPQQQQHGQDPAEQYEGRPQTPPPSIPDARPDPPSCAERTAKTTNNRKNSIQSQQQPQRQHQVEQLDPTPQQNERPSLKDKLFNYVAPIPDPQQTVTETAAVSSPSSLPSSVTGSSSEFSTPHPQRPTMAAAAAATFDSPPPSEVTKTNEQQQHVEKSPPPPPPNMTAFDSSPRPEPTIVSPIPDAAPTAPPLPTPPSPSAGTAPPPPPSAVDSNGGAPLPPPPPPPRPPTPPAPDAKNIRHSSHNSSSHYDDDDAGSEYTDGSYTDGEEYTDDEGEEEAPKSGGLFGVFMPAPPKMEY